MLIPAEMDDRMKFAWFTVLAGSTFLAIPAMAQTFSPSAAEVAQFARSDSPQRGYGWASQTEPFDQALLTALRARSIPKAAQAMSARFGLPTALLEKIIGLRIFLHQHQYDSAVEGYRAALRQRVLDLVPQLQGHEVGTLLLAEMLEPAGHPVLTAGSVQEALSHLRTRSVAVVIVDVQLGGADGIAFLQPAFIQSGGISPIFYKRFYPFSHIIRRYTPQPSKTA